MYTDNILQTIANHTTWGGCYIGFSTSYDYSNDLITNDPARFLSLPIVKSTIYCPTIDEFNTYEPCASTKQLGGEIINVSIAYDNLNQTLFDIARHNIRPNNETITTLSNKYLDPERVQWFILKHGTGEGSVIELVFELYIDFDYICDCD